MKVLIDCRCLQSPPFAKGGVAVYAEQLVRELIARRNQELRIKNKGIEWILFANGLVDPRKHLPHFDAPNVRWLVTRWPNKLWNATSFIIHHSSFIVPNVVFLPNLNFIPRLPKSTKLVVTVHDLSFEHFADCFTWKQRLWHRMIRPRTLLERANAIIAVSETTRRDVVETYGVPEEKVHVVYPGIENLESGIWNLESVTCTCHSAFCVLHSAFPFILTLSAIEPRKNIDGLITAFEQLQIPPRPSVASSEGGDSKFQIPALVIAGIPGSATPALRRQISRSPARDRIHLIGAVTDNEKRALLARAACFAYVSFWEGVGFPALEAMREGCPVVASTGGALPEILGDAALLVDPLDPSAIADALHRVLTDDALRTNLIARGRTRVAQFRWEDAARHVRDILTSV